MRLPHPALSPGGRRLLRWLARHRRVVAAVAAAVCVGSTVLALRPPPPPTVPVLVATTDLPGGHRLASGDLAVRRWPSAARPDGAFTASAPALGRPLAAPVRRGEPVTDVRLVGAGLVDALPSGLVAVPVRIADTGAADLVAAGDHVDVVAATSPDLVSGGASSARAVARDVMVLARPSPPVGDGLLGGDDTLSGGALVVLATDAPTATELAAAAAAAPLSLVLRGR